jgi:16S rRNA (guanine1207-N2)-methyltransferase
MKGEHYYSEKPKSRYTEEDVEVEVLGMRFNIKSASGIFSRSKLDSASKLLIETVFPLIGKEERILDLGCGNGVIGISLALKKPDCSFVLTDINNRAVRIARKNRKLKDLGNVRVVQSNLFEKLKGKFNRIICNPPMATPKEFRIKMINESFEYLFPQGTLYMVARHKKGGNIIEKGIKDVFGNCSVLAKKGGFWIYSGEKS